HIFLPQTAPKAKIAQLLIYGANVIAIKDTYDRAYELAIEATKKWGWYNRNCAYNPYLVEGKKTVALEVIEQIGLDNPPDSIVISIGDGCICSSIGKAITDMYELGFISKVPRIIGVQASGCSPIYDAFNNGTEVIECVPDTIADSIAVGLPRNRFKAMKYLKKTNGIVEKVTDEEILNATRVLARKSGVFGEPAGTTAFAGYLKLLEKGTIGKDENVAVIITGNGLKDIDSAMKAVGKPHIIDPSIENVAKILNQS
ncbi:pyridoxal-phosphate dependent enzyme, partial [bacterium]|nr:pyridoxal-phosphate dependent enzyme [bacterium]